LIPVVSPLITLLCCIGLYAAIFMQDKAQRADRGELGEPSVVQRPLARMVGGIPNSAFGIAYYVLMLPAAWLIGNPAVWWVAFAATAAASVVSAILAYSLLFQTRMPCPFCWTGHAVNWTLLALLLFFRPPHL
jgi:uncharacterized membrane protein